MMKSSKPYTNCRLATVLLVLFCLTTSHVTAQKQYLEITNSKTNRTKKIKEQKKITVYTNDTKVKGFLKVLNSETILIKDTEIKISDIIKIENKSILAKIISAITIPIGAIFLIAGSGGTAFSTVFLPTGIVFSSLGLIAMLTKKKYEAESYQFKIVYD